MLDIQFQIETKRIKELRKCKIETLKKKNISSKGDANNKRKALYNIQRSLRLMKQISKEKNLKFSVTMQNFKEVLKGLQIAQILTQTNAETKIRKKMKFKFKRGFQIK